MIARMQTQGTATENLDADELLRASGNALLIGVLLDQQVRAEVAFQGPLRLQERIGHLDMAAIAEMDEAALAATFSEKPAIHRFPSRMAGRVRDLAGVLVRDHGGDAARLWSDGADVDVLRKRALKLPGFGEAKVGALMHALQLFGHRTFEDLAPCTD